MPRALSVPVRQMIVARVQQGQDAVTIASDMQLCVRTVQQLVKRFRDNPKAITPCYRSGPRPAHPLQAAAVNYRQRHPCWGAELIRVYLHRDHPGQNLPCARTMQRWFVRHGLQPAHPGRKPKAQRQRAELPHQAWQMDAVEQWRLLYGQKVSWLRLVDECSGAFLHTRVFPIGYWADVPLADIRQQLRDAFTRWGLPKLLQVDNGYPWGSKGDLTTDLALWLIGLGIDMRWSPPRRPQDNGVVERSQGTSKRWGEPQRQPDACALQAALDELDDVQRYHYPYYQKKSRMECYQELEHSGRDCRCDREDELWDWQHVARHMGVYCVSRQVDQKGQISIYHRNHYVGVNQRQQTVSVMFNGETCEWVIANQEGTILKEVAAVELRPERIRALEVTTAVDAASVFLTQT